ncbi:uncharacterized protein B0T23DRAFT_401820 [Neurospora hispaniola]|uniref:Uncharacterized protein n=1 Tax=Neurospora hispaniola TaxID=588809 RepID=A0AAJ0IHH5_9PEZI|nr:hypothetical protein B0T23DRAFT_401820 [Neurospora hispaniola]
MVNTNPGVNPLNHPMVQQEVDKEDAIDTFIAFLEQDPYADSYTTKLANALQDIAVKYKELADDGGIWHEYFELTLDKFLWDLPKTREELYEVVRKLTEVDVVHEAAIRGVQVQVVPKSRDQATSTSSSTSTSADAQVDAIAKRIAEYLLADGNNAGGRKVEGENATIFRLESDDTPCTIRVYSGDGTGPAILTVKVHKENGAAKPSELPTCAPSKLSTLPTDAEKGLGEHTGISAPRDALSPSLKNASSLYCATSHCPRHSRDQLGLSFGKMVNEEVDKRQEAADEFATYLTEDTFDLKCDWEREISIPLKDLAVKYGELSPCVEGATHSMDWHNYFVMSLKKLLRDLPSTTSDLGKALEALKREEVAADARARGVHIQILPGPPTPSPTPADECIDETPEAPNQQGNNNANGKRPAENQAEDKVTAATDATEAEAEAQDRPAKRVKHDIEAKNATTSSGFTVETEGSMSLTLRTSDDTSTSIINLNGHGPAIVTVNVQKKHNTASASARNNNKEAEKEGAA